MPPPQNGYPKDIDGWVYHDVYVKNGMVYDRMGLGKTKPIPLSDWLNHYGGKINIWDRSGNPVVLGVDNL